MAKKYYAVKNGRVPGIYKTWDECKEQVHGFPGAEFKGFELLSDAEAFINAGVCEEITKLGAPDASGTNIVSNAHSVNDTQSANDANDEHDIESLEPGKAIAYVDGSYDAANERFSCGAIILTSNGEHEISEAFNDAQASVHRNVAGEIMGARRAIEYCMEQGIKSVDVYHDYNGLGHWGNGTWKTNTQLTRDYSEFVSEARKRLDIKFIRVKGHSGNKYNDIADKLASDALK